MFRIAAENECGVGEYAELEKSVAPRSGFGKCRIYHACGVCLVYILDQTLLLFFLLFHPVFFFSFLSIDQTICIIIQMAHDSTLLDVVPFP